jgi:hypothetical protein
MQVGSEAKNVIYLLEYENSYNKIQIRMKTPSGN